jgi:hypothetical protein
MKQPEIFWAGSEKKFTYINTECKFNPKLLIHPSSCKNS